MKFILALVITTTTALGTTLPSESLSPVTEITQRVHSNLTPMHIAATYSTVSREIAALKAIPDPMSAALESQYGESLEAMREYLLANLDDAEAMLVALERAEACPPDDVPRAIEHAEQLSQGIATPPTVEHLLMFHPEYAGCGMKQLSDGLVATDRTDGSGAGDGLAFTIERPASWMPTHTRGNASVYRIRSEAASGLSYVVIRVLALSDETELNPADLYAQVFEPDAYPNRHPIRNKLATVFDRLAETCVFYDHSESGRGVSRSVNKHYLVVYKDHIIKVETSVKDLSRSSDDLLPMDVLEAEFNRVEPLFDEIVKRMRVTETE